jgi:hypothetical protein
MRALLLLVISCALAAAETATFRPAVSGDDGMTYMQGTTWNGTEKGGGNDSTGTGISVKDYANGTTYTRGQGLIRFDTSTLPDNATITAASVTFNPNGTQYLGSGACSFKVDWIEPYPTNWAITSSHPTFLASPLGNAYSGEASANVSGTAATTLSLVSPDGHISLTSYTALRFSMVRSSAPPTNGTECQYSMRSYDSSQTLDALLSVDYTVPVAAHRPPRLVNFASFVVPVTNLCIISDIQGENGALGHTNFFAQYMVPWTKAHCSVVFFTGDLADSADPLEYAAILPQLESMRAAGLRVVPLGGNHDAMNGGAEYSKFATAFLAPGGVPLSHVYAVTDSVGMTGPQKAYWNVAYDLTISGVPTLVFGLQDMVNVGYQASVITWAKGVEATWLQSHSTGRVWILEHGINTDPADYVSPDTLSALTYGSGDYTPGKELWDNWISTDRRVTMTLCGHLGGYHKYVGLLRKQNTSGDFVSLVRVDYQDLSATVGPLYFFSATGTRLTGHGVDPATGGPDTWSVQFPTMKLDLPAI